MIDFGLAERCVTFLNGLILIDRDTVSSLLQTRVKCNSTMVSHPSVYVLTNDDGESVVGFLGILNGLCSTEKVFGPIVAVLDSDGMVNRFYVNKELG